MILQSTSLHNHVVEKAQGLEASLMTLATGVDAADKSRVDESRQLRESLEQIGNTVTNQLNQNEQSSQQRMQLNSEQIAAKFDQLRAISADQSQTIVELLHQIHGCLKAQSSAASPVDNTSGTKLQDALYNFTSKNGGMALSATIDRLSRFTSNSTTTYDSDEAEDIIDDLECIINALLEHDARSTSATSPNRKRKRHADNRDPDVPHEIKKIRGILTASRAIEIGGSNPARTVRDSYRPHKGVRHSMEVYNMTSCNAVVSIKSGTHRRNTPMSNTEAGSAQSVLDFLQEISVLYPRTTPRQQKYRHLSLSDSHAQASVALIPICHSIR